MGLFRRRTNPDIAAVRDALRRVTAVLDAAQRALLAAVPTARDPGAPLGEALEGFLASLDRAGEAMPAWRHPGSETLWDRCNRALAAARAEAERLRTDVAAGPIGFEALNARLGDVVSPLEEFADAADELR